jgi:hypothetical protein
VGESLEERGEWYSLDNNLLELSVELRGHLTLSNIGEELLLGRLKVVLEAGYRENFRVSQNSKTSRVAFAEKKLAWLPKHRFDQQGHDREDR